jgi:acyl-CoA thioesterase
MEHPYANLIGLHIEKQHQGQSTCSLVASEKLYNPHRVVHGGVLYALADTGMGAALYTQLVEGESCATIEIKINYFRPVTEGTITCTTTTLHKGKRIANLESSIYCQDKLIAKANGTFSIFPRRK